MSDEPATPSPRRTLVGGVIGRVVPAVIRQVDTNELLESLDVNALAAELDLDALVDRLDINAVANRLDLDALMQRIDLDLLVQRLDINAIAAELDLDALMQRLDMAQLTAGATQDVAVSGIDLVRRQLVRADAAVEGTVDRVLHRQPGGRPDAPGQPSTNQDQRESSDNGETDQRESADNGETDQRESSDNGEGQLRRRDVSGHYAGPVTRGLALAGDIAAALAIYGSLGAAASYFLNSVLGLDIDLGSGSWVELTLLAAWMLLWFAVPVAAFGRTPGMAVAGLAVVRRDGGVVHGGAAVVRALVIPISLAIFLLGMIGMVIGRERRTLYDVAAGTVVVYDWGARQAEQPVTIRDQLSARARRRPSEATPEGVSPRASDAPAEPLD